MRVKGIVLLSGALFAPAISICCLLALYVDYFFWDEWNVLVRFSLYTFDRNPYAWSILWEPHFSHRLVVLKLLSLSNFVMFGGNQLPLLLLAWFTQLGLLAIMVRHAWQHSITSATILLSTLFLSLLLFVPTMMLAWLWPMCLQQVLTVFFYCAAMNRVANRPYASIGENIVTVSFAVLCTFSSGNGLVVWPAWILKALLIRAPRTQTLLPLLIGGVTMGVYFAGMPVEPAGENSASLSEVILYVLAFLGSPLGNGSMDSAVALGACAMVLYATVFVWAMWKRSNAAINAVSYGWLAIASALAGAGFRIGSGGVEQALVARYVPLAIPLWASIVLGCGCLIRDSKTRNSLFVLIAVLAVRAYFHLLGPGPIDPHAFQGAKHSYVRVAHDALMQGVFITSASNPYVNLFPSPSGVLDGILHLRQYSAGPFRIDRAGTQLGVNISAVGTVCHDCDSLGELRSIDNIFVGVDPCKVGFEKGVIARGVISGNSNAIEEIVLANAEGMVVGFGFPVGQFRFGLDPTVVNTSSSRSWTGYVSGKGVSADATSRSIRAFARTRKVSRLIPMSGEIAVAEELSSCQGKRARMSNTS